MSHKPWLSALALAVMAASVGTHPAWAIETSSGPATSEGAAILFKDARDAYEHGLYSDAVAPIQRLLHRYPGYPDAKSYHELRAWLGHSLLAVKKPEQAITPLQSYIEGAGRGDLRIWARIWLIEAYLQLQKYGTALIACHELKGDADHLATPELEARTLLLEARSLIALNREKEAGARVSAAAKPAMLSGEPKTWGEQRLLVLELKMFDCSRWPSAKRLTEAESIDQLERRGVCLEEAVVDFEKLALTKSEEHISLGQQTLTLGFEKYLRACHNPPAALAEPLKKTSTPQQKAAYQSELSARISPDCFHHAVNGASLLSQWKESREASSALSRFSSNSITALIQDLNGINPPK